MHGVIAVRLVRVRAGGPLDRERVKVAASRMRECTATQSAEIIRMILLILMLLVRMLLAELLIRV